MLKCEKVYKHFVQDCSWLENLLAAKGVKRSNTPRRIVLRAGKGAIAMSLERVTIGAGRDF